MQNPCKQSRQCWVALSLSMVCWLLLVAAAAAAQTSSPSTRPSDLQAYINAGIKAGEKRIIIPPGRYRVTPIARQHLVLKGLHDVEIIADGVEMVCTQTTRALSITDCRNVRLMGLTIDYDPLPFTQGRIVRMSPDKKVHEIELFAGYPTSDSAVASKYEIFRPDTRTLRCHDYDYSIEPTGSRSIRLTKTKSAASDLEQVGDLIVINAEHVPDGSEAHAITIERGVGVRLERISLYASNCFGFFEMDCDGTTYDHCKIDRRAPSDDPIQRGDPRLRSLDADAYHSKFALKGPSLINCMARFQGDDGVNICGAYHMVTAVHGNELRVLQNGKLFGAGETLEIFTYDGRRLPDAKALAVEPDGKVNDAERAFISNQHMANGIRTRWIPDAFKVKIDREVALPMGSLVCSTARVGNGFLVKGCDFSFNRSRGILIKASDGEVIDNTLIGNWGPGILVSPEYWWLEAGSSNNVLIRGNVITDCRTTGVFVTATGGQGELAPAGAHNDIVVADNKISGSPLPNIHVTSTERLRIYGNTTTRPAPSPANTASQPEAVLLENCVNLPDSVVPRPSHRQSPSTEARQDAG